MYTSITLLAFRICVPCHGGAIYCNCDDLTKLISSTVLHESFAARAPIRPAKFGGLSEDCDIASSLACSRLTRYLGCTIQEKTSEFARSEFGEGAIRLVGIAPGACLYRYESLSRKVVARACSMLLRVRLALTLSLSLTGKIATELNIAYSFAILKGKQMRRQPKQGSKHSTKKHQTKASHRRVALLASLHWPRFRHWCSRLRHSSTSKRPPQSLCCAARVRAAMVCQAQRSSRCCRRRRPSGSTRAALPPSSQSCASTRAECFIHAE